MFDLGHQIFIFILLFFILSYGSCLVKLQCDLSQKIVIFCFPFGYSVENIILDQPCSWCVCKYRQRVSNTTHITPQDYF